jgi:simple sugar transport system ATP-binding protein
VIELVGLKKTFGQTIANQDVHLKIKPGSIHAVIGENGAGKSTAMKILYGMSRPDSGKIIVNGNEVRFRSPFDAMKSGIGMVHQHFMLSGPHSALENLMLSPASGVQIFFSLSLEKVKEKYLKLASKLGFEIPWETPIEDLSVGTQQRLEILKLLGQNATTLILDEPTAVLTPQEVDELFNQLENLKKEGKAIVLITHKLKEVMKIADEVTVFRNGSTVYSTSRKDTTVEDLAFHMIGRRLNPQSEIEKTTVSDMPILKIEKLCSHVLKNVNLQVRPGEIVGIAGVSGNGQTELIDAIFRPRHVQSLSGSISFLGNELIGTKVKSTSEIKKMGLRAIPEDRHGQAILLQASVKENYILGLHREDPFSFNGVLSEFFIRERFQHAIQSYSIAVKDSETQVAHLSGGNQQKLVVAREMETKPKLLVAAQPTRGVDIGAIEFIHNKIIESKKSGMGVLLISTELDEILALSDRILVIFEGAIVGEFMRGQCSDQELGMRMGGAQAV